jgi:PAS domain S-box-containing protein
VTEVDGVGMALEPTLKPVDSGTARPVDASPGADDERTALTRALDRVAELERALAARDASGPEDREAAIFGSETHFRTIVDQFDAIVFVKDEATQRAFVSHHAEQILGHPPARLAEPGFWRSLVDPDDLERVVAAWDGRTDAYDLEYRMRTADGRTAWLRERMHPDLDAEGRVRTWYGIAFDVTELKRLETEHLRSQRLDSLGRLASSVAHDFDNVLYSISIFADYLRAGLAPDDPLRGDAEQILVAVERGKGMTRQLLDFSRGRPHVPAPLDPVVVVRDLLPMLERSIGGGVRIRAELEETGPIVGDRTLLEQIVVNLATNARDAMPDGGTLRIAVRPALVAPAEQFDVTGAGPQPATEASGAPGEAVPAVELIVRDDGIGMDARTVARAFEPFYSTKVPGAGTGLGLATVRANVRRLGGDVRIESSPGAGTAVRILLPRLP